MKIKWKVNFVTLISKILIFRDEKNEKSICFINFSLENDYNAR